MHSTKISGLAVDTEYTFHLVLRTTAGTFASDKVTVCTHKMTDLSGVTITTGIMPASTKENLVQAVERIGAKIVDGVRIDTTHFVTTEGRGQAWEKAVEQNIPVVRPEWVDHCERNGRILGVTKFYLDAMRPGPAFDDSPMPSPLPKPAPEPETPGAPPRSSYDTVPPKTPRKDGDSEDEVSDDDEEAEEENGTGSEQKAKATDKEHQKVRFEDQATLRPKPEGNGERDDNDSDDNKPAVTPDRASFQEVAL